MALPLTYSPQLTRRQLFRIGSIAVSESDPNIVYVASGEGLQRPDLSTGDGVYKSTDAGKTGHTLKDYATANRSAR